MGKQDEKTMRRVVVILGAPGAGASMLAHLLVDAGLRMGQDDPEVFLIAPPIEHAELVAVQDDLAHALDCGLHDAGGAAPMPSGWLEGHHADFARRQLTDIIEHEVWRSPYLWGFLDPITLRFLPLWQQIFNDLEVCPVYLAAVRHPALVIASLVRNGFSPDRAEAIWRTYHEPLLAAAQNGDPPVLVQHEDWFVGPQAALDRLVALLHLPGAGAERVIPFRRTAGMTSPAAHEMGQLYRELIAS